MSFSFLGVGCHDLSVQSQLQLPGSYQYTHKVSIVEADRTLTWPVYIDRNFSLAEREDILQALAQWNLVLNGHAQLAVVDTHFNMNENILKRAVEGRAFLILKVAPANRIVQTVDQDHDVLGVTPDISMHWIYLVGNRMYVEDAKTKAVSVNDPEFISVTMHEMGHALGAEHTSGGLMNAYYDPEMGQCIDYKAMVQVADFYGWDKETLNYCYWATQAASR
jgi:hypothetical protein